jgi:hypothetical protein
MMLSIVASGQELKKNLHPFEKVIVSPKINLVLTKGDQESIRLVYNNVSAGQINIYQSSRTLHIFLDDTRIVEKRKRIYENDHQRNVSVYKFAQVTAYVTYRELKNLEVRGEQEVSCDSLIVGDKFKLKAYGEAEIFLAGVETEKFKAVLYGRNKVKINSGNTEMQTFRLYGENRINTKSVANINASSRIYGEGKLTLTASNRFRLTSFGEPYIEVNGFPEIRKGIIIGNTRLDVK